MSKLAVSFPSPKLFEESSDVEDILMSVFEKKSVKEEIPKEGELKISVKTACCSINKKYNIKKMCAKMEEVLNNYSTITPEGKRNGPFTPITKIDYTKIENTNQEFAGEEGILVRNSRANNNFYNSICISIAIRPEKNINLMIFTNGSITCTGSKKDNDGLEAANLLLNEMKKFPEIFENPDDVSDVQIVKYEVVMINSNFFAGFFINNHKLYDLLINRRDMYKLYSAYDPRIYQGVKISFMWNSNQTEKNGVCCCKNKCKIGSKKKNGLGEGNCRKISVAVFGTGKVLIAGAKSDQQLFDTHNFILKLLQDNYKEIVQYSIDDKKDMLKVDDGIDVKKAVLTKKLKV